MSGAPEQVQEEPNDYKKKKKNLTVCRGTKIPECVLPVGELSSFFIQKTGPPCQNPTCFGMIQVFPSAVPVEYG
jgi:hypothetical protein